LQWVFESDNLVARVGEGGNGTSQVNGPQREKYRTKTIVAICAVVEEKRARTVVLAF
jgi:hypothetical protein